MAEHEMDFPLAMRTLEAYMKLATDEIVAQRLCEVREFIFHQQERLNNAMWIKPADNVPKSGELVAVILDNGDVQNSFYSRARRQWFKDTGFMVIRNAQFWANLPERKMWTNDTRTTARD